MSYIWLLDSQTERQTYIYIYVYDRQIDVYIYIYIYIGIGFRKIDVYSAMYVNRSNSIDLDDIINSPALDSHPKVGPFFNLGGVRDQSDDLEGETFKQGAGDQREVDARGQDEKIWPLLGYEH